MGLVFLFPTLWLFGFRRISVTKVQGMKYLKVRVLPISGVGIFLIYICIFAGATVSGTPEIDFVVDIITYLCS